MKTLFLLLFASMLTVACAGLPEIHQSGDHAAATHEGAACERIFPQGRWQFTHAIEARPPGGSQQTMIGVIRMSHRDRSFECAMMTLEGLVLFEAHYDGRTIAIRKAVPPLDAPGLAQGLVADILLVFFAPRQRPTVSGTLPDNSEICRYAVEDRGTQDIVVHPDGRWQIRRYSANKRLTRTITTDGSETVNPHGFPSLLELEAHGPARYGLKMRLVEAFPINEVEKQEAIDLKINP
jgi:hypothetical protein